MADNPAVVAVVNSSPDVVDLLRIWFEQAGLIVLGLHTWQVRDGDVDLETLVRQHQPRVIVYDLAPPYEPNWRLLEHVRRMPIMAGREFILTSTNADMVKKLVHATEPIMEIVGKPYDLDVLLEAVRAALGRSDAERA